MTNTSILAAFERMWQHIVHALSNKANVVHTHDVSEIDGLENLESIGDCDLLIGIDRQFRADYMNNFTKSNVTILKGSAVTVMDKMANGDIPKVYLLAEYPFSNDVAQDIYSPFLVRINQPNETRYLNIYFCKSSGGEDVQLSITFYPENEVQTVSVITNKYVMQESEGTSGQIAIANDWGKIIWKNPEDIISSTTIVRWE